MEPLRLVKRRSEVMPPWRSQFPRMRYFAHRFDECLASGDVTNYGKYNKEFEEALTLYLQAPTVTFSSGMSALTTMLMAADVAGGEVICPSFTFCATPHAIRLAGATPVFADISTEHMTINPHEVEKKITPLTRAILGVDVYGMCCDYDWLTRIGRERGIKVMFDSAPAFGSSYNGDTIGHYGDGQIFSFHASKPFSTMEGGALCSRNKELMEKAKEIRHFGSDAVGNVSGVGLNGKMMEVCALVGLQNLETFPQDSLNRTAAASLLRRKLSGIKGMRVQRAPLCQSPIWMFRPIHIETNFGMSRDEVVNLLRSFDIIVRKDYSMPCHKMPIYNRGETLIITEKYASQVVSLPVYNDMTEHEMDRIAAALHNIQQGKF